MKFECQKLAPWQAIDLWIDSTILYRTILRRQVSNKLRSRPSESSLADFCTSALLKALKINLLFFKKKQMVKLSESQTCKSLLQNFTQSQLDCRTYLTPSSNPRIFKIGGVSNVFSVSFWCLFVVFSAASQAADQKAHQGDFLQSFQIL